MGGRLAGAKAMPFARETPRRGRGHRRIRLEQPCPALISAAALKRSCGTARSLDTPCTPRRSLCLASEFAPHPRRQDS